jgi:hypothetical protein
MSLNFLRVVLFFTSIRFAIIVSLGFGCERTVLIVHICINLANIVQIYGDGNFKKFDTFKPAVYTLFWSLAHFIYCMIVSTVGC